MSVGQPLAGEISFRRGQITIRWGTSVSYATHLYSVDIAALKSAVGSKDEALLKKIRAAAEKKGAAATMPSPRIRVSYRSEIELNGQPVTTEELKEFLKRPELTGQTIITYQQNPPRGKKCEGEFREIGSFCRNVLFTIQGTFTGIRGVTREQFEKLKDPPEEMTSERALEELIAGKPSQPGEGHHYGYALEKLCGILGTFLDAVGTDCLRELELKTPLSKERSPVKLPKIHDFPVISYLDAAGFQAEVERLRGMDLSFPKDRAIEKERKRFLKALEKGARKAGRGVVGFYY